MDESALEDLRTLVDLFLDEEEKNDDDFLIFLRLSPVPEYLVKGYDFKMLNKQDSLFSIPSLIFRSAEQHRFLCFQVRRLLHSAVAQHDGAEQQRHLPPLQAHGRVRHWERRMNKTSNPFPSQNVSESSAPFQDSLLDVVIGLGATDNKIILTGTAFGNVFTLIDAEQNMPGASVSDVVPLPVTYQQVCKAIKNGNWTLEREEDMTGPYTYNGRVWIAFDDDISLKIKVRTRSRPSQSATSTKSFTFSISGKVRASPESWWSRTF